MWNFFQIRNSSSGRSSSPHSGHSGLRLMFNPCYIFSRCFLALRHSFNSVLSHSIILACLYTLLLSLPLPIDAQTDTPVPTPSPTGTTLSSPTPFPTPEPMICVTPTPVVTNRDGCPIFEKSESLLTERYRNSCARCLSAPVDDGIIPSVPMCGKPSDFGLNPDYQTNTPLPPTATRTPTPTLTPESFFFEARYWYDYGSANTQGWTWTTPIPTSSFQLSGGGIASSLSLSSSEVRRYTSSTMSGVRTITYRLYDATFSQSYYVRPIFFDFWGYAVIAGLSSDAPYTLRMTLSHFDNTTTVIDSDTTYISSAMSNPYNSAYTQRYTQISVPSTVEPVVRITIDWIVTYNLTPASYFALFFDAMQMDLHVSDGLYPVFTPTPTFTATPTFTPTFTPAPTGFVTPSATPYAGDGTPRPYATQDRWGDGSGEWSDCSVPEYIDETPVIDFQPPEPVCAFGIPCDFDNPSYECHTLIPQIDVGVAGFNLTQVTGIYACIQWVTMPTLAILGLSIPLDFLLLLPIFYIIRRLIQF